MDEFDSPFRPFSSDDGSYSNKNDDKLINEKDKRIATLEKALSFYSERTNWEQGHAYSQNSSIIESDLYLYKGHYFFGGKLAKETLGDK